MKLLFLSPNTNGGTVTYTAHLAHALQMITGELPIVYRMGSGRQDEAKTRLFGYGLFYRNMTFNTLLKMVKKEGPVLIAHAHSKFAQEVNELVAAGAWFVVHDPGDARCFPAVANSRRIVVIRKANLAFCPHARFIPHPFVRFFGARPLKPHARRPHHAVTLSRLAANKKTGWVLEANRVLPEQRQIQLRGVESRMFTWGLSRKYPEFKQDPSRGWPKEMGAAERIAEDARWLVDLTDMPGDGGGSQYTFLHALDAGCAIMLNRAWIRPGGVWQEGFNCLTAGSPQELADTLARATAKQSEALALAARSLLNVHEARHVASIYQETIR